MWSAVVSFVTWLLGKIFAPSAPDPEAVAEEAGAAKYQAAAEQEELHEEDLADAAAVAERERIAADGVRKPDANERPGA